MSDRDHTTRETPPDPSAVLRWLENRIREDEHHLARLRERREELLRGCDPRAVVLRMREDLDARMVMALLGPGSDPVQ